MNIAILGGGLAGLSLAYFLQGSDKYDRITILEKEDSPGGLCRSLTAGGYTYDIGPHILFAKDKEMLALLIEWAGQTNKLRRSNKILHKGCRVNYPFENDLSNLPPEDLDYAVKTFLHNPYADYEPQNMLQFFLKTFGEGITNLYLRPYNEKIWKHDPCFMDTQMVDRIPKPTVEELLRSAKGETVEGYLHQLYFDYPSHGGTESVIRGLVKKLSGKCKLVTNAEVEQVSGKPGSFKILAGGKSYEADDLVSSMPIHEFIKADQDASESVRAHVAQLKYNSIIIMLVQTKKDFAGANLGFTIADKSILFHRLTKIDFYGEAYHQQDGSACYLVEVTYRQGDWIDQLSKAELESRVKQGLQKLGLIVELPEAECLAVTKHQYAYVLYDLNHKENMTFLRESYAGRGIWLNGRFGNFEYWNMDRILRESKNLAERICQ